MSLFGTSRFTALLAAFALSGTAGTFWWALETRSEMKAATTRAVSRMLPVKAGGRAPRSKDEYSVKTEPNKEPDKFEAGKFELMGKSERPQQGLQAAAGRSDDPDHGALDRSVPARLVNYPVPAPNYPLSGQVQSPSPRSPGGRADMPLPAMLATPVPVTTPAPLQARAADPLAYAPPAPAPPPPLENPRRQTRDPKPEAPAPTVATRSFRPPTSFYTEQYIEQGEFRYRRRPCEPPNMPDVCYMRQADRHPIIVAKP